MKSARCQIIDSIRLKNENLLEKLEKLITNNGSFKDAVYISEQGFKKINFPSSTYYDFIAGNVFLIKNHFTTGYNSNYHRSDSLSYFLNVALYDIFCKSIPIKKDSLVFGTTPFKYNFSDPQGDNDFTNTFVTKLLVTHEGNCRSLTYLYKILADEVGAKCWLSLAPNHIYIRNYSKQVGWYNTELTSESFPTDAWIAASGYINTDAIRSGLYMDTLSNQQAIGLCILDLLHGYIRQSNNYTDGFVLKGCDLVLKYHPVNPMALLLKAEALKRLYQEQRDNKDERKEMTFTQMQNTYAKLLKLGYREMPKKAYEQWLVTLEKEKDKYQNKQLPKTITPANSDTSKTIKPLKAF